MSVHLKKWQDEEKALFKGWDFSYLDGRMTVDKPLWDYIEIARSYVKNSRSLLDMGTGGGEKFSQVAPFPDHTVAIEGWEPNVPVAKEKLEPLGVQVLHTNSYDNHLPFKDEEFDTVLNRHSGYRASEVFRILSPGGIFITQQVRNDNYQDLVETFDSFMQFPDWTLKNAQRELEEAGMRIEKTQEWQGEAVFKDVGALVYFLKSTPWIVKDFSVERDLEVLEKLQKKIEEDGKVVFHPSLFFILAKKP